MRPVHALGTQDLEAFLQQRYDPTAMSVAPLRNGGNSESYRFLHHPGESETQRACVLRIGRMQDGYRKDAMAVALCPRVPVPRVLGIGALREDPPLSYAVSEFVEGELLGETITADRVPAYLRILDSVHAADISALPGYGKMDAQGHGRWASWEEFLQDSAEGEWREACDGTFLERDLCERIRRAILSLVAALPPVRERSLFHGDMHSYNMLRRGEDIVAVLDWEQAGYGDPVYDLAVADLWDDIEDPEQSFRAQAEQHYADKGAPLPDFPERLRLYGLIYGLELLEIFARNGDRRKYDAMKARLAAKGWLE